MDNRIRVLICEDHTVVREGLHTLFQTQSDIEVVGDAANGREAISKAVELKPDVVLMDISMPDISGAEATSQIKEQNPSFKILVLTMYDSDEYFFKMLSVGATGYFLKGGSSHELVSAVRSVSRGHVYFCSTMAKRLVDDCLKRDEYAKDKASYDGLSSREREILTLIAEGHSNQEIAELLIVSPVTVQTHRSRLMTKLDLHNLSELVRYAVRGGFVKLDS